MKLIVVSSGSFGSGNASSNRHISYLKGLMELGIEVKVILLQPGKVQSIKKNIGEINGIKYEYAFNRSNNNKFIISKILNKARSNLIAFKIARREILNKEGINWMLVLLTKPFDILPYLILAEIHKVPVYHERTEYPFLSTRTAFQKYSLWFYLKFLVPRFDGIFVITKALEEYLRKYAKKKTIIRHIPMTVEVERFSNNNERILELGEYIAYCGSMYTDKDGVPDLIQAFNILGALNDNINLLLIGDNSDRNKFKVIQSYIDSSPFKARIICTGLVARDEMPKYLNSAKILALARPDNIQAKGGFPTKLGEYLATGKPVVVTAVGEIPDYLTDRESAYIAKPDNPEDFASKLIEVLSNYDKALSVGQKGKEIASSTFSYKVQAVNLLKLFTHQ